LRISSARFKKFRRKHQIEPHNLYFSNTKTEDDGQPIGEVSIYHTPSGAQHSVVRVDVPHSDGHGEFNDDSEYDVEEQESIQVPLLLDSV
jgi:hypothetical protein